MESLYVEGTCESGVFEFIGFDEQSYQDEKPFSIQKSQSTCTLVHNQSDFDNESSLLAHELILRQKDLFNRIIQENAELRCALKKTIEQRNQGIALLNQLEGNHLEQVKQLESRISELVTRKS